MILKKTSIFFAIFGLFISCSFAHAQSMPGIQNPLVVSIIPTEPRANQTSFITIQSYSMDLDRALITWYVDDVSQASGVGLKKFSVLAGPLGSVKVVKVTATLVGAGTFTETITIRPADVGLLWEADTYIPPFYKGKALHSFNGSFRVIAIPEFYTLSGTKLDPKELVYTWSKNGEVDGSASGYGKTTYIGSQTSYIREGEDISVEVSAPRDNIVASNNILLTPTVPDVTFYEKSPLYGIRYDKAFKNSINLLNEEITVIAEPFFFSIQNRNAGNLSYTWTLNNNPLIDFKGESEVTLRKEPGLSGKADLRAVLQNSLKVLQGASRNLTIFYE